MTASLRRLVLTSLLVLSCAPALAAAKIEMPPSIDAYVAELKKVEAARAPVSLEPLFDAADEAGAAMMKLVDGDRAWIETLDDAEFTDLQKTMRGMNLVRGYDIYTQPDGHWFLQLAERLGRPADIAFFKLYADFWDAEQMPKYLQLGRRATPCVRFGEGIIPTLYTEWGAYAKQYPDAYTGFTQQMLRDLEEAVALGVCTCTDAEAVEKELRGFVKRFPQTPVANQVRERLQELKDDPERRPVHCR